MTISNEEDNSTSPPQVMQPAKLAIPSPDESPILNEQESGSKELLMSSDLARAFDNVEQLPGTSFLHDKALPTSNTTCTFILKHLTLKLIKKYDFITRTPPININQILNIGPNPSYRPNGELQ